MSHADIIINLCYHHMLNGGFDDIREEGVRAVIHKAGTALDTPDPAYLKRRDPAMDAGLLWGAYYVGTGTGTGREQADDFLAMIRAGSPKAKTLLALDFERYEKNWNNSMSLDQAEEFAIRIAEETGFYPVLYGGNFLKQEITKKPDSSLTRCDLWMPHYGGGEPVPPPGWDHWTIWQYTENGKVGSVLDKCDRNYFHQPESQLGAYWLSRSV